MVFDERLIELIREKEFLYDRSNDNYRNSELKDQEWSNIANELDTTMERCKKRWASLRDRYKRIRKQGARSGIKRRWKHYDALSFVPCTAKNITLAGNNFDEDELLMADSIIEKEETQISSPQQSYNKYDFDQYLQNADRGGRTIIPEIPSEASSSQQEDSPNGIDGFFIYLAQRVKAAKLNSMQEMRIEASILNFTVDKLCEITKQKRNG